MKNENILDELEICFMQNKKIFYCHSTVTYWYKKFPFIKRSYESFDYYPKYYLIVAETLDEAISKYEKVNRDELLSVMAKKENDDISHNASISSLSDITDFRADYMPIEDRNFCIHAAKLICDTVFDAYHSISVIGEK